MADKKYYWLKLNKDFFDRHEVKIIEAAGTDHLLFYIKLLCESVSHNGELRFSDKVPYTRGMLSSVTNTNPYVVDSAMDLLLDLGLIEYEDDGTYVMTKVPSMIGHETKWAEKKRAYRGTSKGHSEDNVLDESSNKRTMSDKSIEYRDKSIDIYAEDISSVNDYTEDELLHLRDMWNQRADTHPVESIKPMMKRYDNLRLCLRLCDKQRIYDEVANIDNQAFFQKLKSEGRPVKFDWFFKPDNFQKVLEGNYLQEFKKQEQEKPKNKFDNFEQREYEDDFFAQLEQKMGG